MAESWLKHGHDIQEARCHKQISHFHHKLVYEAVVMVIKSMRRAFTKTFQAIATLCLEVETEISCKEEEKIAGGKKCKNIC